MQRQDHHDVGQDNLAISLANALRTDFQSGFSLKTGIGMETLWNDFRPLVPSNIGTMNILADLEALADRFDKLKWKIPISVSEMGSIMLSLVKAYHVILSSEVDGTTLVQTLRTEIEKVEGTIGTESGVSKPFMMDLFETIRQLQALQASIASQIIDLPMTSDIVILSDHPTPSEMHYWSAGKDSILLQRFGQIWTGEMNLQPILSTFSGALLNKLGSVDKVDMRSLKLLETELPVMGEKIAVSSTTICKDHILDFADTLRQLLVEVCISQGDQIGKTSEQLIGSEQIMVDLQDIDITRSSGYRKVQEIMQPYSTNLPQHLQRIFCDYLSISIIGLRSVTRNLELRLEILGMAWVHFAIGFIMLYVPNRAFDPMERGRLELSRHEKMRAVLHRKLSALRKFENIFTGQDSNVRCLWIESQIQELGEWTEMLPTVVRPEISELDQLQGEFSNILTTVVDSKPQFKLLELFTQRDEASTQEIKLMHKNVDRLIQRLSGSFRAYRDLTFPIINILRCLQVGLSLAMYGSFSSSPESKAIMPLTRAVPFLGGQPLDISEDVFTSNPAEYMSYLATAAATKDVVSFSPHLRQSLFKTVHASYMEWSKQLDAERHELESRSGLYRFRGSAEDEEENNEEEFNELFPSYDSSNPENPSTISLAETARKKAIQLATAHGKIFLNLTEPTSSVLDLIRQVSSKVGTQYSEDWVDDQQLTTSALLPGSLLLLGDKITALTVNQVDTDAYNFYIDSHLPEIRKLVDLIHQIQIRFRELQAVDEISHMQPLKDVLDSCHELLEFSHTEPLAKVITKVEQIHKFMHEWQFGGWASRSNSVLPLYNNITSTIVNWRRLELSTWSRLFDMEAKRCDDDAKSWWFIAYQVVVAVPISMESEEELRTYSQKLLQDLQTYFATAIIGQFAQRLQLLRQLQGHLELLTMELPRMAVVHEAVTNFISVYTYYETPVSETIKKGRTSLEKSMRDILLLASWKDTNIVALRDSAKRSHHKLFKLIRKFRSLLGQPMQNVLSQGIIDENDRESTQTENSIQIRPVLVNEDAIKQCQLDLRGWVEKPKRFLNMSVTLQIMLDTASIRSEAVDVPHFLDSFVENITSSSAELRKLTPSVLNDDNKVAVKHLKNRKRKLFADTLKELRIMGIKFNLAVDSLSKQDSMSKVLASVGCLKPRFGFASEGLDSYFFKTVDLMDLTRQASRSHSDDLSSAEVVRSVGFLEGLLQAISIQRNHLSKAIGELEVLEQKVRVGEAFWAPENYLRNQRSVTNHQSLLQWLPTILQTASELLQTQSKLGNFESEEILSDLETWRITFSNYSERWAALPEMPENVTSPGEESLKAEIDLSTEELISHLRQLMKKRENTRFIIEQILPWTKISFHHQPESANFEDLENLDQKMSQTCDTVLVAIERYKKAVDAMPTSTDEQGWLVKACGCFLNSLSSLHPGSIIDEMQQIFRIFAALNLADDKISKAASAIVSAGLPIVQQYLNILRQAVAHYSKLHYATCRMSYVLAKTFNQLASQGFCTPSENSETEEGKTEKVEGGTGLGDGQGVEDISKDIQDDEDLSELAQEPNENNSEEIEDEKDAVDMADADMEGNVGEAEENQGDEEAGDDREGEEEKEDIEEEVGDVDDLDPNAVDEKLWNDEGDPEEKEQESDKPQGKASKDEKIASEMENKGLENDKEEEEVSDEEMVGEEQGEEVKQDEGEKHDPNTEEAEALELPDEMQLDGKDEKESLLASEDGIDDLSDMQDDLRPEEEEHGAEQDSEEASVQGEQEVDAEMDNVDLDKEPDIEQDEGKTEEVQEGEEGASEEEMESDDKRLHDPTGDANKNIDNAQATDTLGVGEDQEESQTETNDQETDKAQRNKGDQGGESMEQNGSSGQDGEQARQEADDESPDTRSEAQDSSVPQPFKKLGDVLENWHKQQIKEADPSKSQEEDRADNVDLSAENQEFQHLQDEDAEPDTQAMGTGTEDQVRPLDESMGIDSETKEMPEDFQPDEVEQETPHEDAMDVEENLVEEEPGQSDAYEGRAGAMIKQAQDRTDNAEDTSAHTRKDIEEDVEEVDNQLESTHLDPSHVVRLARSAEEARAQWSHYENLTRPLSLSLTEQLRLILAPTLATKMRGDFRTGKRLNIKRIIPYIASQYKRDKIWMRRSVPCKRSYQIMLAVDDSKSMGESGSGSLAFETLVMVSKSLSLLEVGEICVVGFGETCT